MATEQHSAELNVARMRAHPRRRTNGERSYAVGGERARYERVIGPLRDEQVAQGLGWFSIGLGLTEILAPRALGKAVGVGEHRLLMRLLGLREIASGVGLLAADRRGTWAWSRVAGDAMDLALLGVAASLPKAKTQRIAAVATAVAGVTALDVYASQRLYSAEEAAEPTMIDVTRTVTINGTPEKLYEFWRNLENLPLFMRHLESVSVSSGNASHWVAKAPAGLTVEWDAEIVEDQPDRRISWRTLPESELFHEGTVSFEPAAGGRGTAVRVDMRYRPPGGTLGAQVARLFGEEPRLQVYDDLRRFKQLIETGEIATTEGQPAGRRSFLGRITLGGRFS